jgi:hypothetical protein
MRETQVSRAVKIHVVIFWVLALCSLVCLYKLVVGVYCLHLHRSLVFPNLASRCRVSHDYSVNFECVSIIVR